MSLRLVTCKRCGHEWATRVKPTRCAKCRTPYWNRRREDEAREPVQRHPTLPEEELRAVEYLMEIDAQYREHPEWTGQQIRAAARAKCKEDWERYEAAGTVLPCPLPWESSNA